MQYGEFADQLNDFQLLMGNPTPWSSLLSDVVISLGSCLQRARAALQFRPLINKNCTYSSSIRHFHRGSPVACRSSCAGGHTGANCCTGTLPRHKRDFLPRNSQLRTNTSTFCEHTNASLPTSLCATRLAAIPSQPRRLCCSKHCLLLDQGFMGISWLGKPQLLIIALVKTQNMCEACVMSDCCLYSLHP
jgi:hypothetical protein